MPYIGLPPPRNLGRRSSGMLCGVGWQVDTAVSNQPVGPSFKFAVVRVEGCGSVASSGVKQSKKRRAGHLKMGQIQRGLVVSMLAAGTQDRGFKPGRRRRIFSGKNPQRAFLRRGSKTVCPMSQLCGMLKIPTVTWKSHLLG
jgi:hypothetical protein